MAACRSSHGGAFCLSLMLLLISPRCGALAVPSTSAVREGHTLDDALVASITAADVEHNDVQRFMKEGLVYMESQGIKISAECERRFGYTFITDQKFHHFRLCKSEVKREPNGKLSRLPRFPSTLAVYRKRFEKKDQARKDRKAQAAAAKLVNTTNSSISATIGSLSAGKRRSMFQHRCSTLDSNAGAIGSTAFVRDGNRQHIGAAAAVPHGRSKSQLLTQQQPLEELQELHDSSSPSGCNSGSSSTSGGGGGGRGRRQLWQNAGNSSGSNSLTYKILKFIESQKDGGGGDTSDVYNDDDSDATEAGGGTAAAAANATAGTEADLLRAAKREAWIAKKRAYAATIIEPDVELPQISAINTSFKSSVNCYLQPSLPRNVGYKDAQLLCLGRNVVLDSCAYYDGQHEGFDMRFPKPKVGALKLGCHMRASLLGEQNFTKGYKNRLWWLYAQDDAYNVVRQSCAPGSGEVVEHPVAFVIRDRYTHTLHELEVLATIFTSLAVVDLPEVRQHGIQIIIADQMPHASYRATYAAISYPYRLRHLAKAPYPPNTCFRTALFINAFTNSIAFNPFNDTANCFSPVMIGVHKWLRNLHKELDPSYLAHVHHHASETGGIVRRSIVWTSRRNLEALRLTSGVGMTEWQSARLVPNENQLVTALQAAILRWNSRSCLLARYYEGDQGLAGCRESNVQFDLVFGEFSDWPYYPDQLMTIHRTGILIGVHGAALTFITTTTAGESALLELAGLGWEDSQTGNMLNLFPSLAHNMGAYYEQVRYQGPDIDQKIATDALERAMDEVSRRITANQKKAQQGAERPHFNDQYNFDVMFPEACATSVRDKVRRYVTSHQVQMDLNATARANSTTISGGNSTKQR